MPFHAPPNPENWGPWRSTYDEATTEAVRMCKDRGMSYLVLSNADATQWRAAQLPKKRRRLYCSARY